MKKVILIAYNLDPNVGSEAGRASAWLDIISKHYYTEVFTLSSHKKNISNKNYVNTTFHFIEIAEFFRWMRRKINIYNITIIPFFKKVRKELERNNSFDAVLIHCLTPAGIHAYNNFYKLGIPIIVGPLGGGLSTPKHFKKAFRNQYITMILRDVFYQLIKLNRKWKNYLLNADKIILGAGFQQEWLPKKIQNKCIRIPDAIVDTKYFVPSNSKERRDFVRVLFAGRLISNKGPLLLLDAVRLCIKAGLDKFMVEMAGRGPLKKKLEKQIHHYKLEKYVILLNHLSKEDLLHKYQNSDIFCFPTLREPGGTVILEAMACELPIITSNYGGPAIFITEDCGIKIDMIDYQTYVEKLADSLSYLIKNPEVRHKMGFLARKRAEREFSLEAIEKKVLSLYREMIG